MKMEIEYPKFTTERKGGFCIYEKDFDIWWEKSVVPINKLLREGRQVFFEVDPRDDRNLCQWMAHENKPDILDGRICFSGLLLDAQPIKRETPEEVLREIIKEQESWSYEKNEAMYDLVKRAKRALEVSE